MSSPNFHTPGAWAMAAMDFPTGACGTKNFPSSEECFKCGAPRP